MNLSMHKSKAAERKTVFKSVIKNYELYLFMILPLLNIIIFHYVPMYGAQIAFRNFMPHLGIWESEWVGFEHFERFFRSFNFWLLLKNTLGISLYTLAVGFPVPIILALMINEARNEKFKKTVQMVTYMPHFISTVVMVGMIISFLSPQTGIVNIFLQKLGFSPIHFMQEPKYYKTIYVLTGVWQGMGWNSIIYIAALAGISPELYEAASIDGASRMKQIWHVSIPGILPTVVIMLIMNAGAIMSVGYEKSLLMQNSLNLESSEIISTYVYKVGLEQAQYSFSAAVSMFNNVINLILLVTVNKISGKLTETSLW